jgi:hypothetical protein
VVGDVYMLYGRQCCMFQGVSACLICLYINISLVYTYYMLISEGYIYYRVDSDFYIIIFQGGGRCLKVTGWSLVMSFISEPLHLVQYNITLHIVT